MTTVEALRAMKVFNTHDILQRFAGRRRDVALVFHTRIPRACSPAQTRVYRPGHSTDPNAHWSSNGCKTFIGVRSESQPEASDWASDRYRIAEWGICPTDRTTLIPLEVRKKALAAVKDWKRSQNK